MNDLALLHAAMFGLAEQCPAVDTSVLTHRQIVVLYLRYCKDMDTTEVAEVLGCSVRAVQAVQARALARLREVDYA